MRAGQTKSYGRPGAAIEYPGLSPASRSRDAAKAGGARRDRTADLLHAMQALSQLSYGPVIVARPQRDAGD